MKVCKSEKGMILVTILVVLVIFSVIGMSIISFTVANAKQTSYVEQDMQAVDVAEMGIVRYQSELVPKIHTELKAGIEVAIKKIDQENEQIAKDNLKNTSNPKPLVEINYNTVIKRMNDVNFFGDGSKFLLGYQNDNKNLILPNANSYFTIIESKIELPDPNLQKPLVINVNSKGVVGEKTNQIDATFEIDMVKIITEYINPGTVTIQNKFMDELPYLWTNNAVNKNIGSKECGKTNRFETDCIYSERIANGYYIDDHIKNINSRVKENVWVKKGDLILENSNIYIEGNLRTDSIKELKNSNIQTEGNISFGNMNGESVIENVKFKTTDSIRLGTIGGAGIINSMLHGNQQVKIDNINKGGIKNSEISSREELLIYDLNDGVVDSLLYSGDNINFKRMDGLIYSPSNFNNGGILRSKIVSKDIINFPKMNKGIEDSFISADNIINFEMFNGSADIVNSVIIAGDNVNLKSFDAKIRNNSVIYSGDNITLNSGFYLSSINGSIDSSSFICAKDKIANGIKEKGKHNNVIENVTLERCLELAGRPLGKTEIIKSKVRDFIDVIDESVNNANYIYK